MLNFIKHLKINGNGLLVISSIILGVLSGLVLAGMGVYWIINPQIAIGFGNAPMSLPAVYTTWAVIFIGLGLWAAGLFGSIAYSVGKGLYCAYSEYRLTELPTKKEQIS